MPSPRLLAVTALAALGGLAGVISAGDSGPEVQAQAPTSNVRGGLVSNPGEAPLNVAAENEQPGTRGWRSPQARIQAPGLAAYAGADSAQPGEQVPLFLKGSGAVQARAFRLGWYGGTGARQVWAGTFAAQPQNGAPADWQSTGALNTAGWPQGSYLVRLDLGQASRYVPLTVSAGGSAAGRVVVITSPMTWAASTRAGFVPNGREVSLDKPLATGGQAVVAEAGVIAQIERTGTDVHYLTDLDLAAAPELVQGATAVLVAGESRYWTVKMRGAVRSAVSQGTNLAFFGSGTASVTATPDPADPRAFTTAAAKSQAAARLTGSFATCPASGSTGLTVTDPLWWGYEGNRMDQNEVLKGLVSGPLEKAVPGAEIVGSAALPCGDTQTTSYLERDSGAGVFTAGTGAWACTVTGACTDAQGRRVRADARAREIAALVTRNVAIAFATPKAATAQS